MKRENFKRKKEFIKSAGHKIYVEFIYPKKVPAPAVIMGHGLVSFYPGFQDRIVMAMVRAGFIGVKFHYFGTGKSDGQLQDKTYKILYQNFCDILDHVSRQSEVTKIGFVGKSDSGNLALYHGKDQRLSCYGLLAPSIYHSQDMEIFIRSGKQKGGYIYNNYFKRIHTKGPQRVKTVLIKEHLETRIKPNVKHIPNAIMLQGSAEQTIIDPKANFEYFKKYLPKPNRCVLIPNTNHSYFGKKKLVINELVRWFKQHLR